MPTRLRLDEQLAAERLVVALREGRVHGLPSFDEVSFREVAKDPPDIIVRLDARDVGVELARIVGEAYAAGISADLRTLKRGGRPEAVVWKPDPVLVIDSVVARKTAKYTAPGVTCPDWLVLHDSVERPGWHDQSVEGHAYFAERCAMALRASPFRLVIFQSTYRSEEQWSVVFDAARDVG